MGGKQSKTGDASAPATSATKADNSAKEGSAGSTELHGGDLAGNGEQRFDAILVELQQVVERLEQAELPLEQALEAFERGVALSRRGQAILDAADRKVEMLLRNGTTESFNPAERP